MAVNCCVWPLEMDGVAGVTAMDCKAGGVTVSEAVPETEPEVAVMVLVPAATEVARPPEAIVAADVFEDVQVAVLVRFCVEASV